MATTTQVRYLDGARPLRWHEAVAEYVPARHRVVARRYAPWLPIALLTLLFSIMTMFIRQRTAFIDEALYINVGYEYLSYWFDDGVKPNRGSIISGVPFLYPVVAASIDWVGGLWLVRTVSLALMVTAIVLVARMTIRLVNYRAGVLAAAAMSLAGPVIFLGQHATHDAVTVTLLAGAAYLGATKDGWKSAIAVGVLLIAASAFKYTGVVFVPAILALTLFTSPTNGFRRVAVALITICTLVSIGTLTASNEIIQAIRTTTFDREGGAFGIIAPASHWYLLLLLRQFLGILLVLSAVGAVVMILKSWRMAGVAVILVTTAAILPVSHMMLGELSSYEKHLGWSAVFLAPLAGAGLDRISRTRLVFAPVLILLAALALNGEIRSEKMVYWGDVSPVIEVIDENPVPGTYLAVNATVMDYHTRDDGYNITWLETYDFWDTSPAGLKRVKEAVENEQFSRVIVRGDETGNPAQNKAQEVLLNALYVSRDYTETLTDRGWRIFTKVRGPA